MDIIANAHARCYVGVILNLKAEYLFVDRHIRSLLTYTRVFTGVSLVVVYSACIRAR